MNVVPIKEGQYDLPRVTPASGYAFWVFPAIDPQFLVMDLPCPTAEGSYDDHLMALEALKKTVYDTWPKAQDLQFLELGRYDECHTVLAFLSPLTDVQRKQVQECAIYNEERSARLRQINAFLKEFPDLKREVRDML